VNAFGLDFVTIHEFGHGYFYGILASNEFEEPMLDEGMNQYWDQRMLRERGQRVTLTSPLLKRLGIGTSVAAFETDRLGAGLQEPADGLGKSSWERLSSGSYGSVYSRTATAMHELEQRIGKEALERGFKTYYATWKFRHPSVADLRAVLAETSGQPAVVDEIFKLHVYAANRVDDRVESLASEEELPLLGTAQVGGRWMETTDKQHDKQVKATRGAWHKAHPDAKADDPGPFPYRTTVVLRRRGAAVPQKLVVKFTDGSSETVAWNDEERWARYIWVKPVKAVSAELDPERLHSMDAFRLDNARLLKADGRATRRLVADAGGLWQALLALVATL
jgi:hypothetical protein